MADSYYFTNNDLMKTQIFSENLEYTSYSGSNRQKTTMKKTMTQKTTKSILIYFNLFVLFFLPFILNAQLTGVKNIPGDYATLADAITDLNNVGVGAGGTTLNIIGGNPQTAPVGGYQITASGTSVNPIIIQGNTNTITAFSPQPLGSLSDAIFKIIGGDYITITGLTIQENPSNIINNPGGNIMTEWAIALFYASPTNGAQNNTIINNQISLNRLHPNSWAIYSSVRHTSNLSFVDITSISGSNFNNKIYSNSISNVNFGIAFIGSPTASLMDIGNDIGGTSLSTGNTIVNWGGSATTLIQYPSNTTSNYCILMNHQTGDNVSFNTIQSAPNLTMSANTNFYGIYKAYTSVSPIGIFTININHNKLTMTGAVANRTLEHIRSEGLINLPAAIININNNLIINSAITGISTSGMISGINNLSSPGIININNNIIQNLSTTATTGNVRGISNDGSLANTTNVNINNNQFGNTSGGFITYVNANSGNLVAISSLSGTAVTNLSITGNDIRGINQTIPSTTSFYFIQTGNNALTLTISNNTFTSLIINTNQNICFFKTSTVFPSGGSQIVSNNAIVGSFVNNGGGGFITIFEDGVGSPSTTTQLISGNNFSNITSTGTTTILGWETRNGFSNKTIVNNTFTNWTGGSGETTVMLLAGISNGSTVNNNVINQITSEAKITGIRVLSGGVSATTARITDNTISNLNSISTGGDVIGLLYSNSSNEVLLEKNTIHTLSSTGIASVTGISLSQGNPVTVSKNKIYSLSGSNPSSIISGITTSAGSLITINNNLIGNLSAPATNSTNGIIGVNITGGSTVNVYFNTIYLNGSSTGNNFGSSGIYAITSSIVDMQNNLIVNLSSSTGSGLTTAYRRSSSLLTNYAATSNNNSFYAGIPSATNLIFHDGTNSDQTLASYKTRVSSRDNASVSENPVFVSTNGASSGFLHIPFGSSYFLESAGSTIIGVSSDYDNDVRPGPVGSVNGGATAPDIGADEYDGISLLICAGSPSSGTASISPLSNCSSGTFTLSLTGASSGPSITYQWQSSASSGGPYTNIAGATSPTYTTSTINSTTYFVCVVTCTTSGQSTTSIEITGLINPSPVVTAGASPLIICSGATTTLSSSGANTYVWSPGNISGSSVSVSPTITTTYTVLGTNALTGCTNTASVLVTVTPAPSLSVSATSTVICQGSFTTLSATGANTYLWNPGSLNGSFISVSPTTTTTYTVTGTNTVTGCSNSQTITITVNPPPTITTSTLTPFICIGSSAILNASGASTYVWNPGNLSGGSITVTPTSTTTYTVTGTNSITGCSSTQTLLITVNPLPTITTLSSLPTVCNGNPVSLSATGANTYVWNPGNLTGSSVSVTPTSTTTYTVTGTNTLTGCSNMQTLAVTVLPTPTVTANATSNSICFGGSTSLNANGADTYVWIPGSLTGSVVSVSPTVTTTYTVIGTNSLTGCSNTATITITVNTPPTVTASAVATTICSGGSTILSASGADTYVWSPGNLSGSSVSVSPSTTTTYTVTGTNNFTGCSNTAISTITVSSLPIVSTSLSASPICLGNSAILSASGANTYTWNPGNQNGASISVSPTSSTTYTVIGTNTSTGCINTATTTIIVNPLPLVNANASIPNICSGGSATLSATGATNFVWNPGNLNSASVNVSPTSTTTYTVTGTNASTGCTNTATTTISVNPLPIITAVSSVSVICVGESTTLTASGGDIYVWSPGNLSGSSVNVSPTVTTSYTVTGINTLTGCTNTATVTITVNPLPSVSATSFASSICLGSSTTLIASGASTYVWNPGNQSGASVIVSPTSTTTYTVTGTNTVTGCVNTQTLLVTVNPLPQLTTTSSVPAICIGDQVTLNASGASSYVWNPGNQSGASVIVSPTSTTMYTVTGTNIVTSCVNTQTLLVTVNPLPQLTTTSSVPAICIGDQVTLNATGASTYVWSPGNQSGASVIVSPTSTTTYTVTGTNTVTGCVNTQTLLVTVNPLPQLTTTSSVPAICIGDQVTLNATGASTYVWNPGNQSGASVIVSPTSTTTYTVTGTNALTGCVNTATLSVTVNPLPQLTLTSSVQAICIGDQVTLNASGASTYVWNPGALSGAVVNVSPAATTTYTVIGTNSLTGCIGTRTITVTVNSVPVVALGVDTTVCGGPYVLDAQNSGSAYLWSNNTTAQTLSVTTTGVYGVIVTDANGCSSEDSVSITINALPVVSLGADTSVCGPLVLNAGNVGSTYLWSSGDTSQTIAGSASGTYAVLVTNSLGCSSVDSVALTINPLPVVSLGNDISSCAVGPVTLDAGNVGMQYLWSSGNTSQTILVGIAGSYAVTVSDSLGCSATDSVNVSFTQLPTVTLGNDTSLCGGSLILDAGNTGSTYAWSNGDTTQTIVVIATALYGVTVTDSLGCSSTDSILVRVNTAPVIVFPLTQDTLCTLDTLFALTVSPAGGTFSGSFVTGSNFDPVASGVGTYTVYYTFTDTTTGCTSTDSATLVVDACTGIADNVFSETLFTVYPNPNNGFFNLALTNTSNREIRIQVYTVFGQVVYSDIASGLNGNLMRQIDLTNLANGAYYIRVTVGTTSQTMKVIKQD